MSPSQTNSNIHTDTKNLMLKSIFVLTNVLLHFKQTGLHKKTQKPFNINKVATCIYYHHPPPPPMTSYEGASTLSEVDFVVQINAIL